MVGKTGDPDLFVEAEKHTMNRFSARIGQFPGLSVCLRMFSSTAMLRFEAQVRSLVVETNKTMAISHSSTRITMLNYGSQAS